MWHHRGGVHRLQQQRDFQSTFLWFVWNRAREPFWLREPWNRIFNCISMFLIVFPYNIFQHWCRRRGGKRTPETFDLVKIRAKYVRKFGQNVWIPSQNCCECYDFTKIAFKIKVQTFFFGGHFLWSIFRAILVKFGEKSFAPPKICLLLHLCFSTLNATNLLTNVCIFKQNQPF